MQYMLNNSMAAAMNIQRAGKSTTTCQSCSAGRPLAGCHSQVVLPTSVALLPATCWQLLGRRLCCPGAMLAAIVAIVVSTVHGP